jgi:uncharacterized protein YcfL
MKSFIDIAKFFMLYFGIILLALYLSGCISTQQHARNLVKRGTKLIKKGMELDKSVSDSVKTVKKIEISVPGETGTVQISPEVDSMAFAWAMGKYDSSLLKNDSLIRLIKSGHLNHLQLETALADQIKANDALKLARERMKSGFLKDSTYIFNDSLLRLEVIVEGGKLVKVNHQVKDRVVSKNVETTSINLDGRTIIAPWKQNWFWIMAVLILLLLLVILVLSKR